MQSPILALGLALAALVSANALADPGEQAQRLATMSETEFEAGMKQGVQVVLQRVPIQMDDQSVLVGAEWEPAARVATYHYVQVRGFDPAALRSRITAKNCTTPNTRAILGRGITFRHLYTAGNRLLDFSVSQNDCRSFS